MILKVAVLPAGTDWPAQISLALFRIDGRFMFDTSLDFDDAEKASTWLQRLFTEKLVVEVAETNGEWAGSFCGEPKRYFLKKGRRPAVTRSWLGKYDALQV